MSVFAGRINEKRRMTSFGLLFATVDPASSGTIIAGLVIIAIGALAVLRRVEVRIVMSLAALALGLVAGQAPTIVQTFLATLSREQFVLPICSAMGFAHVLR